jgi:transglutaminase-like putative cysteine protease
MKRAAWDRLAALALSTVAAGLAGYALHRVIDARPLLVAVLVAATMPTVLAALWRDRVSLWLAVPASVVVWLLMVTATQLRPAATAGWLPNSATLAQTAAGLGDSWRQMLGTIPPVGATAGVLITVSALVWFAAAVSAEVLSRTRATAPALLPSLSLLLLALPVAAGGPGSNTLEVTGWLLAALLLLLIRRPGSSARQVAAGFALAALVAVVAAAAGPLLVGSRAPFDLRQHVALPSAEQPALDPLAQVSAWLATPQLALFQVTATSPQNWRLAVLDRFDGVTWTSAAHFIPTGSRVPAPPIELATDTVNQHVTVDALTGVWLPAAESATSITGTPAAVDPATGVLLSPHGLRPALEYDVTSAVPRFQPGPLEAAVPADDPAALVLPPGLPSTLADTAQAATVGATFPYQQATRLAAYLRTNATYDPQAPPGHTYGHLGYFLDVSRRGTSEQFATAFAVMARTLGLPSRVVVGFRAGTQIGPGAWQVVGADVLVWPEVEFAGLGWVPFYPTPDTAGPNGTVTPAGSSSARQLLDDGLDSTPAPAAEQPGSTSVTGRGGGVSPVDDRVWILAAVAGLAAGYLLLVLVLPPVRTAVRRRGYPVVAAWSQALGWLRPAVSGDLAPLTATEVAQRAGRVVPSARPDLQSLAALADAAAFSGQPAGTTLGRSAWRHAAAIRRHAARAVRWPARLRHRLSPRRLWN